MWLDGWPPLYSRKQIVEKRGTVITVCMSNFDLFLRSRLSHSAHGTWLWLWLYNHYNHNHYNY